MFEYEQDHDNVRQEQVTMNVYVIQRNGDPVEGKIPDDVVAVYYSTARIRQSIIQARILLHLTYLQNN